MRIKITMLAGKRQAIDINYNYYLSSLIYNLLSNSNEVYASFLHNHGYENNKKSYKMFTFSKLFPENYLIDGSILIVEGKITWFITSPIKEFLLYLVNTLSTNPVINIGKEQFQIINIEALVEPQFTSLMKFKCLSPVTISTAYLDENSKLKPIMLYIEDIKFTENLKKNVISKYEVIHGKAPENQDFNIKFFDIEKYKRGKLINYKNNIKVKGYLAPFEIQGNPELIQTAYECGLGDKNSLGMGMIEVYERR